uniref:Calcyclin-binding protein n=1 Tax=Araucaria cunninghamii TaxID=56994 RepID=A0A0D6R670_ARACU
MDTDLNGDLEELRQLQSIAKRPRVLSLLSGEIHNLEKAQQAAESTKQVKVAPLQTAAARSSEIAYTTIGSFSWDQENEKVKIYVSLEGVNQEQVVSNFQPWSFDVKFHDIQGKNYRCAVPKLNKAIVPEKCRLTIKPHRVIITLQKAEKGNWQDLYNKGDKLKPSLDNNKDPMAGIMDLMKNMYDEGDEDMKRTIAKAWSEARSGKKPDPLKGYDSDL